MNLPFTKSHSVDTTELFEMEQSTAPDSSMNLLLRFETLNGPRTVIACSVPLATAREVSFAMRAAGHHAAFIDRCAPLSVADRLLMKRVEQPDSMEEADKAPTKKVAQKAEPTPYLIAMNDGATLARTG